MDYGKVLRRAWDTVWRHRALWILGALVALTTVNGVYLAWDWDMDRNELGRDIVIKVNERSSIYLPGEGLSVDLSAPGGATVTADGTTVALSEFFTEVIPQELAKIPWMEVRSALDDVSAILIAMGVVLAAVVLVSIPIRYTSEAGLIRAVNEIEESGETLGLRRTLRLGWSRSAWRLFLIDLVIRLPLSLALVMLYLLALAPLALWVSGSFAAGVVGTALTTGLFVLVALLTIAVRMALSLLMQVIRRSCAMEELGVVASIRQGVSAVKENLSVTAVTWLIWIGMRLAWMVCSIPVMIVLLPVTLLFMLIGAVLGGVPAVMVGGALSPALPGAVPWIVGGVAGLPIFVLAAMVPMLFVSGLVEVLKSSTWTLAYRELRAKTSLEPAVRVELDGSGMEAAPAA